MHGMTRRVRLKRSARKRTGRESFSFFPVRVVSQSVSNARKKNREASVGTSYF